MHVYLIYFQNESFEAGAISCIDLCGIGKLTHNMVLMGYKVSEELCELVIWS